MWQREAARQLDAHREREAAPVSRGREDRLKEAKRRLEQELAVDAQVNTILASLEPAIRTSFETGLLQTADHAVPGLQDVVANFDMVKARETAWANAETLWALQRTSPALQSVFEQGLDHLVGFAGRGLLVPLLPAGSA